MVIAVQTQDIVYEMVGDAEIGQYPVDYIDKAMTEKQAVKKTREFALLGDWGMSLNIQNVEDGKYREECGVNVIRRIRVLEEKIFDGLFAKDAFSAWVLKNKDYYLEEYSYYICALPSTRDFGEKQGETSKKFNRRRFLYSIRPPNPFSARGSIRWSALGKSLSYGLSILSIKTRQLALSVLDFARPLLHADFFEDRFKELDKECEEAERLRQLFLGAFWVPSAALLKVQNAVKSGHEEKYFFKSASEIDSFGTRYIGHKY